MKVLPEPRQLSPSAHPTRISVHLIFHARPLDSVSRRSSVRGNRIHLRELCPCVHRYYSRSNLGQWSARSQHEWRELPLSFSPSLVPFLGRELFMNNTYTRRLKTTMTRLLEIESHVRPIMYSSLFGHFT